MIVEAVPNFSEGRRPKVIAAIVEAMSVDGVMLLGTTSDHDHNRTVVTLAGSPNVVVDALFQGVRVAAQHINLFEQRGTHPRLGATDVVPLVPIEDISLRKCVELAVELGARIGRELELPVYLYEAAATRPERRNLADIRRGEFEKLVEEISTPARRPDFGPARMGPAGAVIVGARRFLIAYNFFLATDDVEIARQIARSIRQSSGGFPGVKAIGLLVGGRAQVSMNLVDFSLTSLATVTDAVRQQALAAGTRFERAELIGLLPQQALLDVAIHALQLPDLKISDIVENAIRLSASPG